MSTGTDRAREGGQYRVLDAGCGGGRAVVDLPDNAHVVGIDSSPAAIERNHLIDEAIIGDLQTFPLEAETFDEIVCSDVLEHLPHPDLAFANLARSLKPGGTLTIRVPNLLSTKGLITKFTPHWFHIWIYKRFWGMANAGQPGVGPWRTYLRWSVRPRGLARLARANGLEVEQLSLYGGERLDLFWDRHRLIRLACQIIWPFEDPRLTECQFVARKPRGA